MRKYLPIALAILLCVGCVRTREAAYYRKDRPAACDIRVYDGPKEQGKVLRCISRDEWRNQ